MAAHHHRDRSTPNDLRFKIITMPLENKTVPINKNQYYINKKLGNGAFGSVYAARRLPDSRPVAIKVVSLATRNDSLAIGNSKSVLNEIEMSQRLARTSKHIAQMYDFDFHDSGLSFLVMELGEQDLEKYLAQRSVLSSAERKSIWRQLVDIAMTLDNYQIVHLDIKPANLVVFPGDTVKLVDLGIAQKAYLKRIGPNGTPPYSAPEVTMTPHHHMTMNSTTADIWSWGAVLYRITYMRPPDYNPPCYRPPINQHPTRDSNLRSVLRHTLVIDPRRRCDPSWLARHPYTRTI